MKWTTRRISSKQMSKQPRQEPAVPNKTDSTEEPAAKKPNYTRSAILPQPTAVDVATLSAEPVKGHPCLPSCSNCVAKASACANNLPALRQFLSDYPCVKSLGNTSTFNIILRSVSHMDALHINLVVLMLYERRIYPVIRAGWEWARSLKLDTIGKIFELVRGDGDEVASLLRAVISSQGLKAIANLLMQQLIPPIWEVPFACVVAENEVPGKIRSLEEFKLILAICCASRKDTPESPSERGRYIQTILGIFNRDDWRDDIDPSKTEEPYYMFPIINLLLDRVTREGSRAMKIKFTKEALFGGLQNSGMVIKPEAVLFLLKFNLEK